MPRFALAKERLYPYRTFPHRLFVLFCFVVLTDNVHIRLVKMAPHRAAFVTLGTLRFEWAGITDPRIGSVECSLRLGADSPSCKDRSIGAPVLVRVRFVREAVLAIERRPLSEIWQGHVRTDIGVFQSDNIVDGAVGRITTGKRGLEMPAEARMPEQILHRLVIHDFRWGDQHVQDDARF